MCFNGHPSGRVLPQHPENFEFQTPRTLPQANFYKCQ
jgi:hypothetical protein